MTPIARTTADRDALDHGAALAMTSTYAWMLAAATTLAAIDLADTWLAKLWTTDRTQWWVFAAGLVTSFAMFVLFALLLTVADIWWVTVTWAVITIAGGYVIDRVAYGVRLPVDVAVVLIYVVAGVVYATIRTGTGGTG